MSVPCTTPRFGSTRFGPHDHLVTDSGGKQERNADMATPLGGGTIFTSFGFKGRTREWELILTARTRTLLNAQYQANSVATLTDREGNTASALMLEFAAGGRIPMVGDRAQSRSRIVWLER